jgi:ATP-dependent DNA ligase
MGEALENFIQACWKSPDPTRFPGPQPVSIERRHFPLLKKQPYFVCEKTDGVRHLLVSFEGGVFLVNRAYKAEKVSIRVPKDTLLDGELVTSKTGRALFMVYDAVRVKGEDLTQRPLTDRLEAARKVVKGIIKTAGAPFEIRVKTTVASGKSRTGPECVRVRDGWTRVYAHKRTHPNGYTRDHVQMETP